MICSNCELSFSKNTKIRSIPVAPFFKVLREVPTIQALLALGGRASCDDCLRAAALRIARDDLVNELKAQTRHVVDDGYIDLTGEES